MGGNGKIIPLFGSLSEGNGMECSFLPIPSKPQILIPLKIGRNMRNKILFNEIFIKTPKIPLIYIYIFINPRLSLIPHLHFLTSFCATVFISNLEVFFFFFDTINTIAKLTIYIYIYIYICVCVCVCFIYS
jgi:hypothetical protein